MNLLSFIMTLALSSTLVGLFMLLTAAFIPKTRFWPLFWGTGLIVSVIIAFISAGLRHLPQSASSLTSLPGEVLGGFIWPTDLKTSFETFSVLQNHPYLTKGLIIIYTLGVILSLLRLIIGRIRAVMIISASQTKHLKDGTFISLTDAPISCMALTPFGRPHRSRIIMSRSLENSLSPSELETVIAHEQAHILRRDDEFGLVLRAFLIIVWFNPITHILFDRWTLSAELQCDQIAIQSQSYPMRKAYAHTLLKALHISADRVRQYPAATLSTQHLRNEKMRIEQIMTGPRPIFKHIGHKFALVTMAMSLSLVSAALMSPTAAAGPAPLNQNPQETFNSFNIKGELSSPYGPTQDPFNKDKMRNHHGIDIKAPKGTAIYAPANGVIIAAADVVNKQPAYGKVVILRTEDGIETMMSHLERYNVTYGQHVLKGQKIAEIGSSGKSTGPHVHIETRRNGKRVDPMSIWHFKK